MSRTCARRWTPITRWSPDPLKLERGDIEAGLAAAPLRLKGEMRIGGQDHFYLEGHIALAIPGEDDDMTVWSSTQHPSEVQHMVAHVLGGPGERGDRAGAAHGRRLRRQGDPVQPVRRDRRDGGQEAETGEDPPDRDDDMIITGKRHDFVVDYDVGYDESGRIHAVDASFAARCGFSSDLSGPVTDRALFHADNCYFYPGRLVSKPMMTNTVSNTAFRGFGGPQGMLGGERMIEEIAYARARPAGGPRINFYGDGRGNARNVTPYHQTVEDNIIHRIVEELEESAPIRPAA
jgi:xanthine dehydrogenase large subunit